MRAHHDQVGLPVGGCVAHGVGQAAIESVKQLGVGVHAKGLCQRQGLVQNFLRCNADRVRRSARKAFGLHRIAAVVGAFDHMDDAHAATGVTGHLQRHGQGFVGGCTAVDWNHNPFEHNLNVSVVLVECARML